MIYYILLIFSAALFGGQFGLTKKYQLTAGDGIKSSFLYNAISPIVFAVIMFFVSGVKLEFYPFTIICSMIWAVIANAITYFSIKSLALGSVANYSVFLLGGGMIVPAVYGFFTGDTVTVFKIIGIVFILVAVCVKIDLKEKNSAFAYICFFAMFLLNGLIGVLSAVYQSDILSYSRSSAEQFAFMRAVFTAILGSVLFLSFSLNNRDEKNMTKIYVKASPWATMAGILNGVANLILLYSLLYVDPSLQYPVITGATILFSSLVGLLFDERPNKKTLLSVALAVAGTIAAVF